MIRSYQGPERRTNKRVRMNCTVIYRINQPPDARFSLEGKDMYAQMVDISQNGMAMVTDLDIPTSTVVSIRFTLLKVNEELVKFSGPMEITGEVRSNVSVEQKQHRLGIYFKKMRKVPVY
ncbi:MAG: PilZ domain-containing protein [Candidatus Omnitrophica bacterium]|nr:PilZ domain-containing protein [Candidatus Omnitrophota bacterium]